MGRDISIAISARDNYSSAITTMRNANQHFNKDLEGLISKLKELDRTKATVKADMEPLKRSLKDAETQYKKTGSAADELALKIESEKYENGQRNLNLISKNARQVEKDILRMTDAISRSDNRAGGIGGSNGGAEAGLVSSLAKAGLWKMAGDSLSGAVNAGISSAFGDATGNAISTTLLGAITGAAIGSMIPVPVIGTAIGAAVGAAAGGITAATQVFEKKDDTFRTVRQSAIEDAFSKQDTDLNNGIAIASKRQMDKTAFTSSLGSEADADEYLKELRLMDLENPFSYDDLTSLSRTMLTFRMEKDSIKSLLNSIGDAGAATGMTVEDMNTVAKTIGQLTQTATATRVDINKLTDRGIPAIEYLAQAKGLAEEDIYELMSKGGITGNEAVDIITEYLAKDTQFKGMAAKQAKTYLGKLSVIEGLEDNLKAAYGEGFMKERTIGLAEQEAFLSGEAMKEREEINRRIGQWKASLENLKEDMGRRMESAVINNDMSHISSIEGISDDLKNQLISDATTLAGDYQKAKAEEDGVKLGEIFASAQVKAQLAYNASEGAQQLEEMQKNLIEQTSRTLVADENSYLAGYRIGQKYSEGMMAAVYDNWNPGAAITGNEAAIKGRSREYNTLSSSNPRSGSYTPNVNKLNWNKITVRTYQKHESV